MQDIRDAFRALKATPIVSAVAIFSLALGIGANTALFSIVDSLMLRSLPVKNPQELAVVALGERSERDSWTYPIWEQIKTHENLFAGTTAWSPTRFNSAQSGETRLVDGMMVSGRFFELLGVAAVLGRTFTNADDTAGGGPDGPVAVISYSFWQTEYGGAADAIGRSIVLDRVSFTIIGVTPPGFFGPEVGGRYSVAVPFGAEPLLRGRESMLDKRSAWWLSIMVRRKPGQDLAAANALLRGVQPQVRQATLPQTWRASDLDDYLKLPFTLRPAASGVSFLRSRYQRPLLTLMVVVGLVLLIACANVANLLLARATARRHELSVRVALGASRARLARQLLAESLLMSACGALLGLVFAHWGAHLLVNELSTSRRPVFLDLSTDWRVLAFTAAVATVTALLFGTAPALAAARIAPGEALKEQGRRLHGETRSLLGNALVVAQVALSLVLVMAALLFVRTFTQLAGRPLGFDRDRVLVVNIELQNKNADPAQRPMTFERLRQAALAVPGVDNAALSYVTPVSGSTWQFLIEVPGMPQRAETDRVAHVNIISSGFFNTFGTRLLAGRDFTDADKAGSMPVAIVNEAFARKFLGGASPLGRQVKQPAFPGRPEVIREIVGYAQDAVYRDLRADVPPTMYLPFGQYPEPRPFASLSVRAASASPVLLTHATIDALTGVTRDISLTVRPLSEQVNNSLIQERLIAMLSGFFGALAVLLASLGLYGVTSYAVSRRRTEIGIRMALGARPAGVVRLVLGRVTWMVGIGIVIGGGISIWASKFVGALLFAIKPRDPGTLAAAALALMAVGALAGWLPARRASRTDPARVLREG